MADQTQFVAENVVIVADDHTVKVFHWSYTDSKCLPTAWVGVHIEPKRHEEVEVKFGRAKPPGQPIYGQDVTLQVSSIIFRIPLADEPRLRAFFADVAARSGRAA